MITYQCPWQVISELNTQEIHKITGVFLKEIKKQSSTRASQLGCPWKGYFSLPCIWSRAWEPPSRGPVVLGLHHGSAKDSLITTCLCNLWRRFEVNLLGYLYYVLQLVVPRQSRTIRTNGRAGEQ